MRRRRWPVRREAADDAGRRGAHDRRRARRTTWRGSRADHILRVLGAAIEARGVAHWATTGGSNPADIYHAMRGTARRDAIDWDAVHVWWGDDRFVPRDHPLSNVKALDEILLDETHGIHIPPEHLHPFRCGEVIGRGGDAARCAAELEDELRSVGPEMADAWPSFDLVFLGMGGDGHLLSVFPGSDRLRCGRLGDGHPGPDPHRAACRAGDDAPGDHRRRAARP